VQAAEGAVTPLTDTLRKAEEEAIEKEKVRWWLIIDCWWWFMCIYKRTYE
jgi:hypothetical protein